jgi:Fe-S oxidoreductase
MCNNNGHCRKFDAGTMCPSYRATRDEQHLTRGRANTLRLALSGQLGADGIRSDAVKDAMDLCVGCKGCRRECPTGVDMARMKLEWLHQSAKDRGPTLRERLVGRLPDYAPTLAKMPWLANLRNDVPGLAGIMERLTGLTAKRALPRWRPDAFRDDELPALPASPTANTVVLFADTFDRYFEPENLRAAAKVLGALGHDVRTARPAGDGRPLCCGRTHLATGDVARARAEAHRLLDALAPALAAGSPIVGLEPSCLFTLKDEYLALGLGPAAEKLAAQAVLLEDVVARSPAAAATAFRPLAKRVLLHGHCHQKAFGAMPAVTRALALVPELAVTEVVSSCCGMAGSFGYEAEHHEMSLRMAEASLLPAVREAAEDTLIVADGTSCRHQIADGTGRGAMHVARVLAMALAGDAGRT